MGLIKVIAMGCLQTEFIKQNYIQLTPHNHVLGRQGKIIAKGFNQYMPFSYGESVAKHSTKTIKAFLTFHVYLFLLISMSPFYYSRL